MNNSWNFSTDNYTQIKQNCHRSFSMIVMGEACPIQKFSTVAKTVFCDFAVFPLEEAHEDKMLTILTKKKVEQHCLFK